MYRIKDVTKVFSYIGRHHRILSLNLRQQPPQDQDHLDMYDFIKSTLQKKSMQRKEWNSFNNYCVCMGFPFETTSEEPYFPDDSNTEEGNMDTFQEDQDMEEEDDDETDDEMDDQRR